MKLPAGINAYDTKSVYIQQAAPELMDSSNSQRIPGFRYSTGFRQCLANCYDDSSPPSLRPGPRVYLWRRWNLSTVDNPEVTERNIRRQTNKKDQKHCN